MTRVRYVAYLRVSTDGQADAGGGLEIQEAAVREWARRGRHRLVEVVADRGVSGTTPPDKRPGLSHVVALLAADRADGVVVPRLDRLARELVLQEQFLAELHRAGKELHSCSPTEDAHLANADDDPSRTLVRQILGSIAQYERAWIRLRLAAGRERKVMAGGHVYGPAPYGSAIVDGRLVKVPDEQLQIRRMRVMRAQGKSYREIGDQLEQIGARSRAEHGKWRPATIRAILMREEMRRGGPLNIAASSPDLAEVSA